MPNGFFRSPEGEAEYAKIYPNGNPNKDKDDKDPYEDSLEDIAYSHFLRIVTDKRTPTGGKTTREILSLTRKVAGASQKEFILWTELIIGQTGLGARRTFFRSMGTYPIPVPIISVRQVPDTLVAEEYISGISEIKVGYLLPFNVKNADLFRADLIGGPEDVDINRAPTRFSVESGNIRITVDNWESWRNGTIVDLMRWGHIPNEGEKERHQLELAGKLQPPPQMAPV